MPRNRLRRLRENASPRNAIRYSYCPCREYSVDRYIGARSSLLLECSISVPSPLRWHASVHRGPAVHATSRSRYLVISFHQRSLRAIILDNGIGCGKGHSGAVYHCKHEVCYCTEHCDPLGDSASVGYVVTILQVSPRLKKPSAEVSGARQPGVVCAKPFIELRGI